MSLILNNKIKDMLDSKNFRIININNIIRSWSPSTRVSGVQPCDVRFMSPAQETKSHVALLNGSCQEDFIIDNIPSSGIKINKPGTYYFSNNIIWSPSDNYNIAISIESNDVIIDFLGCILECYNPNNYDVIGIHSNSVSNISIINGEIKNMCRYGISFNESNNIVLNTLYINGLTINNLNERNLTPSGIFCNKCNGIIINKCSIENINVTSDSSAGIQLSYSQNANISNCFIHNMINNDGAAQGLSYFSCENINTTYCNIDNIQTFFNGNILTTGHTVLGICPFLSSDLIFDYIQISNLIGCCDDCHGVSLFISSFITFKNSFVSNILDGFITNTGAKATGIEIYGSDIIIDNCVVENVKSINPQDKQCAGFSCAGYNIEFNNCIAKNIIVVNEFGEPDFDNIGFGIGFGWAPDPRPEFRYIYSYNITYTDCSSYNCQVAFDTWNHINSFWKNITSYKCINDILIQTNGSRNISCSCCSECNPPINITLFNNTLNNTFSNIINII